MTRYVVSPESGEHDILLMSSGKRMTLNKTGLTDNRKPPSKDLPATNTKTNSLIPIQKEQILVYLYKGAKNTGEGPVSYFFRKGDRIQAQIWAKELLVLSKKRQKVS